MYFKQFFLGCLAHASYLIADEKSKVAAVVDPQRDIEQYLAEADAHGFKIKHVILTHFHADFLAGHLELKDKLSATIHLGARGKASYEHNACKDGDKIVLGENVELSILETPGHTPEGICILVFDREKNAEQPHAVLTGDTLFVGDVGRPDLLASVGVTAEELAGMLYDSLHQKLMTLPDETLVYPAHGAGSMCGKNLGKESFSTIGQQKKFNYALKISDRSEFINTVSADQAEAPQYFGMNAELNKQERKMLHEHLPNAMTAIPLDEVLKLKAEGAQILDTRSPGEFAGGHLKGSVNIGLGGNYASWAGTVLDHQKPLVIIANPGKEAESALRLGRIGYDNVVGYLAGGAPAFLFRPELVSQFERLSAIDLRSELSSADAPNVLDVRTETEWQGKHIDGVINIPLNQLNRRLAEVPRNKRLIVHCLGGYRSMIAASILEANGFENLTDLAGGINAWLDESYPVTREKAAATCS
ncbi:MAG: MBL fold metallo-hydrolase [Candidatus Obscuribacterales bacterium]|nr:MBL fold metallo-hydrolase [Candidatus Obscuribacterales bacterium]